MRVLLQRAEVLGIKGGVLNYEQIYNLSQYQKVYRLSRLRYLLQGEQKIAIWRYPR